MLAEIVESNSGCQALHVLDMGFTFFVLADFPGVQQLTANSKLG
jgi:hypothetical protein